MVPYRTQRFFGYFKRIRYNEYAYVRVIYDKPESVGFCNNRGFEKSTAPEPQISGGLGLKSPYLLEFFYFFVVEFSEVFITEKINKSPEVMLVEFLEELTPTLC